MLDLYKIAKEFRMAIETALKDGEIKEMQGFPVGRCAYASELLQRYLIEQYEFFTWYMSGEYGNGETGESHAWIETQDHSVVIDITGDQYKNKKPKFTEPVYVGSREDGFHDKFRLHKPVTYIREKDPFGKYREFDRRYEAVLNHLK